MFVIWPWAVKQETNQSAVEQHVKYTSPVFKPFVLILTTTITITILWPFCRDHPGELVPEENFWTLWCKGRLTEADTPTTQLGTTPSRLTSAHLHHPPIFYRSNALPATQPTASKHWRQLFSSLRGCSIWLSLLCFVIMCVCNYHNMDEVSPSEIELTFHLVSGLVYANAALC